MTTEPCEHDKRYLKRDIVGGESCVMCLLLAAKAENGKLKETLRHIQRCGFSQAQLDSLIDSVLRQYD